MTSTASTPEEYIAEVPQERREALEKLRKTIITNLPQGFQEGMQYGMIGYFIPHDVYPAGYHCDTKQPLPFMSFASQKNSINFYHMGIYVQKELLDWFVAEFPKYSIKKLDMGKSCIRFKKIEDIPFDLIGELVTKITAQQWIEIYESVIKK